MLEWGISFMLTFAFMLSSLPCLYYPTSFYIFNALFISCIPIITILSWQVLMSARSSRNPQNWEWAVARRNWRCFHTQLSPYKRSPRHRRYIAVGEPNRLPSSLCPCFIEASPTGGKSIWPWYGDSL